MITHLTFLLLSAEKEEERQSYNLLWLMIESRKNLAMLPRMALVWNELVQGRQTKPTHWYWDIRGKIIYALMLLIWSDADPLKHWICYRLDNPMGHHDGEFDIHARRRLQEIKCTAIDRFSWLHRNAPDAEWLTTRFVGIKLSCAGAFEPFLRLSRDYLAGVPIPALKHKYVDDMHGLTFYLSTVGDVINAAQRNADAHLVYPEPHMGPLKHDGNLDYWGLAWAGHQIVSGSEAADILAAAPGGL